MIEKIERGYIVSINKPPGWTSFDVVRKIRNITRIKKVGHAGTLDPFASGVLLICLGRATKQIQRFMQMPKEYRAELELGTATDTLDVTGKISETQPVKPLTEETLKQAINGFIGEIEQRIPNYSAAKVKGQRLYKLARQGKEVPVRYKRVHIYRMELLRYREPVVEFSVLCSRGTYVRTLGADLAQKLGTVGFLRSLTRTRIGDYTIEQSMTIPDFEKEWTQKFADENISSI